MQGGVETSGPVLRGAAAGALVQHARRHPQEPWLFFRDNWNWRWISWLQARQWTEGWVGRLESLAAGRRVGFKYLPRPECIVLDLAIRASGRVPVPVDGRLAPEDSWTLCVERGCELWVEARRCVPEGAAEARSLEFRRLQTPLGEDAAAATRDAAAVVVEEGQWRGLSEAELLNRVEAFAARLGRAGGRDILVSTASLEEPVERLLVAWATVAGAVLVLEPVPEALVATSVWVRPTLFAGTHLQIAELRRYLEKAGSSRFRAFRFPRHFRRLHTLVRRGREALSHEELACWTDWGVAVVGAEELLGLR